MCRLTTAATLLLLPFFVLSGCTDLQKPASSTDSTALVHQDNRVTIPENSPLARRLRVEAADFTTVQRQITAPASVEADPARYARILPPLSGRVLRLLVHPGDTV